MIAKLKNSLFSDFFVYGIGSIVSRSIGLILTPFLAHSLMPEEFGVINLATTTAYFLGIFVVFSLDAAAGRWFFEKEDAGFKKTTIANWFWFQCAASTLVLVIAAVFARPLSRLIFLTDDAAWFFLLPILALPLNALVMVFQNLQRFRRKAMLVTAYNIALTALNVCFILFFLKTLRMGVIGYFLGQLVTTALLAVAALFVIKDWIHPKYIDRSLFRQMFRFALPMVPTTVAFWLLNSSAAYFLNFILKDKNEVGLFGIGASIAALISLVTTSFQQAWGTFFMTMYKQEGAAEKVSRIASAFVVACFALWVFICLFTPEILMLFAQESYWPAAWVPPILSLCPIIYSFSYFTQVGSYVNKDMKPLATAVLLASAATTVLYFLMIPVFKKEGAAMAAAFGQLIVPAYIYQKGNRFYPVRYNLPFVGLVIATAAVVGIGGRLIAFESLLTAMAVKLLLLLFYFAVCLWSLSAFDKTSYATIQSLWLKLKTHLHVRNRRRHFVSER